MAQEHVPIEQVTVETVDQAVVDWFEKTLSAHVETPEGPRRKVPIVFASGERWVSGRERKGLRDKNGVLILPVISLRRTGIEPVASMAAMGVETPNIQVARRVSKKTNDVQNAAKARAGQQVPLQPVVYEITTIPFPDFSVMTYDLRIQAQYMVQANTILEKFFHELDIQKSFVMPMDNRGRHTPEGEQFEDRKPFKGGYFVGFCDQNISSGDNFEEFTDQERIVMWTTTFRVPTYLLLDPEGERPSVRIEKTAFDLRFGDENIVCLDPYDIELIFSSPNPVQAWREIQRVRGVRVTSPIGGAASNSSLFLPVIDSISPLTLASGSITVSGRNFLGVTSVVLTGSAGNVSPAYLNQNQFSVISSVPSGTASGSYQVVVTTPYGSVSSSINVLSGSG